MKPDYTAADFNAAYEAYAIKPELRSPSNFWFVDVEGWGLQPAPREILANGSLKSSIGFNEYGWTSIRKAPDGSYPHEPVDPDNYVVVNHNGNSEWLVNGTTFVAKAVVKARVSRSRPGASIEASATVPLEAKRVETPTKPSQPDEPTPQLLRTSDVARLFAVNDKTVVNWAHQGKITALRTIGGHLRFRREDVIQKLQSHR